MGRGAPRREKMAQKTFQSRLDAGIVGLLGGTSVARMARKSQRALEVLGVKVRHLRLKGDAVHGSVAFRSEACGFTVERRFDLRVQVPQADRVWVVTSGTSWSL